MTGLVDRGEVFEILDPLDREIFVRVECGTAPREHTGDGRGYDPRDQ